jgi:GGDEF domain-containing protein
MIFLIKSIRLWKLGGVIGRRTIVMGELGQRIPKYIRTEDIPCRMKNETFCILLPGADLFITQDRAEKIRRELGALKLLWNILLSTIKRLV